jgi:ribosomal protein L35
MAKGMKTKKALAKRMKVTKSGKLMARKPGFNHFNAKQSRTKQLAGRKTKVFKIKNKARSYLLPFN